MTKSLRRVVAAVSVLRVPIEARMQIGIGAGSPAVAFTLLIAVFVPLIGLIPRRLESLMRSLLPVPRNELPYFTAFRIMGSVVLESGAPKELGRTLDCPVDIILWRSFDTTAFTLGL